MTHLRIPRCSRRRFAALAGGAAWLVAARPGRAHEGHHRGGAASPGASPAALPSAHLSTAAVYLTIRNEGSADDRLLGGETDMAQAVEVHETQTVDGVGRMCLLEEGVVIPAGEMVVLEPGGMHLMLVGLADSLLPGMAYELDLLFARAGAVTVTVQVRRNVPEDDEANEPVRAADLVVEAVWSRPAPRLQEGGGPTVAATPAAR